MKKSSNPVGIAVLGCGRIASVHTRNLARMKRARIVAIADSDPSAILGIQPFAPKAIACKSTSDALHIPGVDAVLICLPPADHAGAAVEALSAEKHVYLEKPFAIHWNEAEDLLQKAASAHRVAMIGFNFRFHLPVLKLKQQIQNGEAGRISVVRSVFSSSSAHSVPSWKQTIQSGGGVLLDLGSHHFDLIPFLFHSKVSTISARVWSDRSEEDNAIVNWQLENGIHIQSFFSMTGTDEDHIEVYGEKRQLTTDRFSSRGLLQRISRSGYEPSYHAAMQHFVQCIELRSEASPSFQDGYESFLAVNAARWSFEQNTPATLKDLRRENSAH